MITQVLATKQSEMNASTSQNKIRLLADLLDKGQIQYKTLLRHLVEIIRFNEGLTVQAVLMITDTSSIHQEELTDIHFEDALVAVRCASDIRTAPILISALSSAMKEHW